MRLFLVLGVACILDCEFLLFGVVVCGFVLSAHIGPMHRVSALHDTCPGAMAVVCLSS